MVGELNDSFALQDVPLSTRATMYPIVYRKRLKEIEDCGDTESRVQILIVQEKARLTFSLKHLKGGFVKHINQVNKTWERNVPDI